MQFNKRIAPKRRYGFRARASSYGAAAKRAAGRIQRVWRSRRDLRRTVRRVSLNTRPTDYYRPRIPTMQPSSGDTGPQPVYGGVQLEELMTIPFSDDVTPGQRMGNKVFWKGLTIRWEIDNARPYIAGNTCGKVRFGIIETRGSALGEGQLLYDPTNTGYVNDTNTPFNHTKVKCIMDRTITIGDKDSWSTQGYRDTMNLKTFHKCNQFRMYEENDATTPVRPTRRAWYLFAIASGFVNQTSGGVPPSRQFININPEVTFSFKDPA